MKASCRDRYRETDNAIEINPYYQGFLNEVDSEWIAGFDWCVSQAFDGYFKDIYKRKGFLEENIGSGLGDIDFEEVANDRLLSTYSTSALKNMSRFTRILKTIREELSYYIEEERDALITSLIDNMPKNEYEEIRNRVILTEYE